MDYNGLVVLVERERSRLLEIIGRIYAGDTTAVNDLNPEVFNEHNKELFLWNAQAMKGKRRYSGKHYYVHPPSAAYIAYLLVDSEDEDRDTAIRYVLTHDLLEIALDYDPELFEQYIQNHGQKFWNELEASVVLAAPSRFKRSLMLEKMATIYQVKETKNRAYAYALIADKLDNQLDLGYMGKDDKANRNRRISQWFIAPVLFAAEELSGILPQSLIEKITVISDGTRNKYSISLKMVQGHLEEFQKAYVNSHSELKHQKSVHYQEFGLKA